MAKTIGSGLIRISAIEKEWQILTSLCALIGATLWDVITWRYGFTSQTRGGALANRAKHGLGLDTSDSDLRGSERADFPWCRSPEIIRHMAMNVRTNQSRNMCANAE